MEVHAHSHTHGNKNWKQYFWEFLMLFLAVFCGFLAENWREHTAENSRAREYAIALVQDLAKDTTELQDVINDQKIVLASSDSIGASIRKGITGSIVPGSFYYFCNTVTNAPVVVWNKATLTQLTQSGTLRYFRNPILINKISYYYAQSDYITTLVENDRQKRDKTIELRNRILNYGDFTRYSTYNSLQWHHLPDSIMITKLSLRNADKNLLNEFANSFESRKRALLLLINSVYPKVLIDARELIEMLKKEYRLK